MNENTNPGLDRRQAIRVLCASTLVGTMPNLHANDGADASLHGVVGITTGGGLGRQRERGELDLLSICIV